MRYPKITDEQLIQAVQESLSYAQVLSKFGKKPTGGNYITLKQRIKKLNIDTSHFTGMLWNKGKTFGPKMPIEHYFDKEILNTHAYKKRLIKEGLLPNHCMSCKLTKWLDKPMPLQLHHIDGNRLNNHIDNLQVLCPNCHAQTDNYCGKNIKKNYSKPLSI